MANFNGQTAVITGGAQGIGLATAKRFIEDGCQVMIWDIDEKMGLEAAKELNCHLDASYKCLLFTRVFK